MNENENNRRRRGGIIRRNASDETNSVSRPSSSNGTNSVSRPSLPNGTNTIRRPGSSNGTNTIRRPGLAGVTTPITRPSTPEEPALPFVEKKTNVEIVKLDVPFRFLGNMNNVTVKRVNEKLGDGDMSTSKNKREVEVDGKVTIVGTKLTAIIDYFVWEGNFGANNPKSDNLQLTGILTRDLDEQLGLSPVTKKDGSMTTTITKSWKVISDIGHAQYRGWFSGGDKRDFMYINYSDYPSINNANKKEWLPLNQIRVKIDGKGSELYGEGNLAIEGRIIIYFELTTVNTYTYDTTQTYDKARNSLIMGTNPVLTDIPNNIRTVMGRGYDITENYADTSSVGLPVLDIDKINNNKLLLVSENGKADSRVIRGESKKELSSSYEKSLNVKVSAHGYGATFSNETKKTIKKENSYTEGRKFASLITVLKKKIYKADITPSTSGFASLLSETFINDLNTMTVDQIIEHYGTHVLLGMVTGARVTYSMSYLKSIEKMSESKSFSCTTSIGYNENAQGGLIDKEKQKKQKEGKNTKEISSAELAYKALDNDNITAETIKQINELIKLTKGNAQPATNTTDKIAAAQKAGNSSTIGGSVTIGVDVNTSESSAYENESLEEECIVVGGNMALQNRICSDLTNINTWLESLNDDNTNYWADFERGTLYPIYECVPAGCKITANALKTAWEKYMEGKNEEKECSRAELSTRFSITGSTNTVHRLNGDREISTSDGKETGWKLYMEPVNLDGGDVAVAVQLTVGENGLDGNRSLLCLHEVVPIPKHTFAHLAIDSTKVKKASYEVQGSVYKKCHGLFDITNLVRDCPFLDTDGYTVSISIDGNGDNDSKNLRVVGAFKVPVIGYDK